MAAGSLLFVISLVGCFGVLIESKLLLTAYTVLSLVTLVLEIGLIICTLKYPIGEPLQQKLSYELQQHIEQLEYSVSSRNFLDLIQLKLSCCGGETFLDYKRRNLPIPQSCSSDITNNVNYRSCGQMLLKYIMRRAAVMGGLAMILLTLQQFSTLVSILYLKFRRILIYNI